MIARRVPSVLLALAALSAAGCAARPDRFAGPRAERVPAAARESAVPGSRGGYARFARPVLLRDDTPSVSVVLAEEEARRAALRAAASYGSYGPAESSASDDGLAGPTGSSGSCPSAGYEYVGPYLVPGGGVWPGLRSPEAPPPASPFAGAMHANPAADTYDHRPGLSTGSGVFGRRP